MKYQVGASFFIKKIYYLLQIDVLPHILEMKDEKNDVSDEERNVMRECIREAFWYRALPLSLLTGLLPYI